MKRQPIRAHQVIAPRGHNAQTDIERRDHKFPEQAQANRPL